MGFFSRFLNGQLLFERIETRILVGITMFVTTMLLVGWVAINEGARMAAFDRQFNARSVERGAAMFSTYCSTCHGNDGLGITGRAPALNNPELFGYDFMPEINDERDTILAERVQLEGELNGQPAPSAERTAEINTRIGAIDTRVAELEQAAQNILLQTQQAQLRGYDPYRPDRLVIVGWTNSRFNFIYSTLVHGRPVSTGYWPQAMPNWAQISGGPLRDDQLRDLTNFIMNWNRDFTIEDLLAVQQFAVEPCNPATCEGGGGAESVGTDVAAIVEQLPTVTGDPTNGQQLYSGLAATGTGALLGCAGCHVGGAAAPATEGTWTRVLNERLPALPDYASGEEYLVHSIVRPNDYVVDTYAGVMPTVFGDQLTLQDMADIVAYLMSQDQ